MKIGVDGRYLYGRRRGIGQYLYYLLSHLVAFRDHEYVILSNVRDADSGGSPGLPDSPNVTERCVRWPLGVLEFLWMRCPFPKIECFTGEIGVFHARLHSYPGWPVHHALGNALARILLEPGRSLTAGELRLVKFIVAVFTLIVFAIAGWVTWPRRSEHPLRPAFEFALALATPLVVGSIVEIHHFVWLLVVFALLLTTPDFAQPRHFWLWLGGIYAVVGLEYWPDRFKILHYGLPSILLMGKWLAVCGIWGLVAAVLVRFRSSGSVQRNSVSE